MVRKEIEFIQKALEPLAHNPNHILYSQQYRHLDSKLREKWFANFPRTSFSCSNCPGERLTLLSEHDKFVVCRKCGTVIPIRPEERQIYRFKMEQFLQQIRSQLKMPMENPPLPYKSLHLLGIINHNENSWNVVFGFSQTLLQSWGTVLETQINSGNRLTLVVVDQIPSEEEQFIHLLTQCGILLISWDKATLKNFAALVKEHESQIELRKSIQKFSVQDKTSALLAPSPMKAAATTAQGDRFEELVVDTCQWLVETILPFGGSYKGFAVPDGLITNTLLNDGRRKMPTLFYDCKSFKGTQYVHKAGIPMQTNYYQDFLHDFWEPGQYENTGFIIFSSEFPEDVQKQITGSAQWQYVQEKCKMFFIGVDSLDRANEILDRYGSMFDHTSFMDLIFSENLRDLEDADVHAYYEKLFPASAYTAFRFIHPDQFELSIVSALITAFEDKGVRALEGLAASFKRILRRSKHANLKKEVTDPTIPPILDDYITAIKKKQMVMSLKPVSLLLLLKRAEEKLRLAVGDDAYEEELERVTDELNKN